MPGTLSTQPFDELRTLLNDLTSQVEEGVPRSEKLEQSRELIERFESWIRTAEQRKRQSDSIIDAALDAVIGIDRTGLILEWNREAENMFNWSAAEAVGQTLSDLIIPVRYRAAHNKGLKRFASSGTGPMINRRTKLVALRRNGQEFPIELTILEPQQVSGHWLIHAFARDLTDRQRAEQAIRASESLYHSLVESLPIHVIRKNLQGQLTFANNCYCNMMGRPRAELLGKTDRDLFPSELAEKYIRDDQRVIETGKVFHDIERSLSAGRVNYFEVFKVPVFSPQGKVVETQAIFWDVTDRQVARQELARERDLLRTLMDQLPDPIYVKDQQGRYVTANLAQAELAGFDNIDQFIGRTAHDFFPAPLAEHFEQEDREVMESGVAMRDQDECWPDSQGRECWFLSSKLPLRDTDGSLLGIVGIDRNITQKKIAEDELKRSNRELDEFVSVVTHDLQAPLRAVNTYCRLLAQESESDLCSEGKEHLHEALDGLKRMQRLIDSLRTYARATERKRPHASINLDVALQQALANLHVEISESDAIVTHDSLPVVSGDGVQLMQLFQNLIANAIKYCRNRQPQVHVGWQELEDCWQISIRDNGIGIEPGKVRDVFRIFQRLHCDESEFSGTGIGLSVCKRIVARHRGRIWVESTPSEGSTFLFTLAKDPPTSDSPAAGSARPC